jgi:hypothetical protein
MHEYICRKAKEHLDEVQYKRFLKIIESFNVGLFVNERFANLPLLLIPELMKNIPEDIDFTQTCEDINTKEFKFEQFLLIAK